MDAGRSVADAVVVGSGPNGLAAAITLARAGRTVRVLEAQDDAGGGLRSAALTLPGYLHDVCSAVHPLAIGSPFFAELPLGQHGLSWIHPPIPLVHALDGGQAVRLERSFDATITELGADGAAYRDFVGPLAASWSTLAPDLLAPLRWPRHPFALARLAPRALASAARLARRFTSTPARALLAGLAAHAFVPLEHALTGGFALMLAATAHAVGWPIARGGAQTIAKALLGVLASHGGQVETNRPIQRIDDLPDTRAVLFALTAKQVGSIAAPRLPVSYQKALADFRYGPAAYKIDYALAAPIPWTAEACHHAAVVHLGGTFEEVAAAERDCWQGRMPERPFVLVSEPTRFDPSRAPPGGHVAWAYAHVPPGFTGDATAALEAQIERFAPGFATRVRARTVRGPAALEAGNANLVGGDINGGAQTLRQFLFRPTARFDPYALPVPGLFIASASTPPGGGVHGMCGHMAARSALRWLVRHDQASARHGMKDG